MVGKSIMAPDAAFFAIILIAIIFDCILFVFFGEKTVRKLRKNPATKNALGIEFISEWDIVNVMSALALPRKLTRKIKNSPLKIFRADTDLLDQYTTRFDRIVARILFASEIITVLAMFILFFMDDLGFFK
jgi:hypothetical protein